MADTIESVRSALADRYRIEREIGSGGMATVYLARDIRHDRDVAVKVLRSELAEAIGTDRFLREIKLTARLNHPHILPLLDSGEAGGLLFYVMPYMAGGSLRLRLGGARLPLDEALRISDQVATALEYAHASGIVHRDIKPENVLFSEGLAIVADFGIAKALSEVGRENLTRSGVPLGTPGYMSPEQAMGRGEVIDERTDVYSLGCVVFEMLVGETPAVWPTKDEMRVGRFLDAPLEQRAQLDLLPGRVEQALVRALAIRPPDRFATSRAFVDALAAGSADGAKYRDDEVRDIVARAAELQVERPTEDHALSIGGVEQVAAEVGIPPQRVRDAIRELEQPPAALIAARDAPPKYNWVKDKLTIDRTVEGEISEADHAALVAQIQSTLGIVGHTTSLAGTLTWSPAAVGAEGRKIVVTVTPQAGRTHIHVEERFELWGWKFVIPGWGAAAGALLGLGIATFLGVPEGPGVAFPILIGGGSGGFLTANGVIQAMHRSRRPGLMQLADRLTSMAERTGRRGLESGEEKTPPKQLK
jgi:serine/threonine protein kinase